jgi:AcrR family transcriptional regulator/site-specific recombinase XerD
MPTHQNPTRQRLINAALELFAAQGVTETTTKQIAELAEVNEVTLFRQFGNKYGLLLAVIEEAAVFTQMGQRLVQQANQTSSIYQALKDYADACLQALERVPEVVRSVVGEAGQYPAENRVALGRGFTQANQYVAQYFETVIDQGQLRTHLPAEKLASLLNSMVLGYAVIEFTSEFHQLWQNREDFLENLVTLFLQGAVSSLSAVNVNPIQAPSSLSGAIHIRDLPALLVHTILQRAKQQGLQEYALIYVLFGAGLSPVEIAQLERAHHISDRQQQLLQITQGAVRQVPVNQWIMGKRYGSYTKNPLTQWLKSRKDPQVALFINATEEPCSEADIRQQWQSLTTDLIAPDGQPLEIEQAQQTWCVEMLSRGVTLENLQILTGQAISQLQPYAQRAREKVALEQAIRVDRKA